MEKIKLCVKEGEKLMDVVDVEIPPFKTRPAVLIWGSRVFMEEGLVSDGRAVFVEVFAYTIPEVCDSCKGRLD